MDNPSLTKNEEELNELKKKYKFLIQTLPDVIWTKDFEGNTTFISPNVEKIYGYTQKEFYTGDSEQIWYERIHPDDVDNVRESYYKLFDKNIPFYIEYQYTRKDGDIIWLRDISTNVYEKDGVFFADGISSDITHLKLTEIKLKETEIKYKDLIENLPDVIWTKDFEGNTTFISPNVEKIYGYSPEEILSSEGEDIWFGRIHPDDVENLKQAYNALFEKENLFDVEYRIKRKDGVWIWLHDKSVVVYEKDGGLYADGDFSDITEQKNIEQALKESEEKFRTITEQSFLGVVIIQDGALKYVNKAITNIYGYSIEEMMNWAAFELFKAIHPEDRATAMERVRRKEDAELEESIVHPYRVFTKAGDIKWVESYSRTIQYKGKNAFLATLLDITAKKEAEKKLKESEEKFRIAFENAADAIFWANPKSGLIVNCNKKAEILLEKNKDEIIGKHQTAIHPPQMAEQYDNMFKRHIKENGLIEEEATVITKSGKIKPVHIMASVTLIGGKPIIQGIFRDISERKKTEKILKDSEEKYRNLFNNMVAGFAHHKVIFNKEDEPIDYIFLEVNREFEKRTGLKKDDILNKRVTEVLPGIEKSDFNWIKFYGELSKKGGVERFEQYSAELDRGYSVIAYSQEKGYFSTIFTDMPELKAPKKQ